MASMVPVSFLHGIMTVTRFFLIVFIRRFDIIFLLIALNTIVL